MDDLESILQKARSLSHADRVRLVRLLLQEAEWEDRDEEIGVGERGLAAWSDSTRDEDWSEFYPASLRRRKVG